MRNAEAHAEVLADLSVAVVDHTVAALAVLELLNEDSAKFMINLHVESHSAQHGNDACLGGLRLLTLHWHEVSRLVWGGSSAGGERIEFLCRC